MFFRIRAFQVLAYVSNIFLTEITSDRPRRSSASIIFGTVSWFQFIDFGWTMDDSSVKVLLRYIKTVQPCPPQSWFVVFQNPTTKCPRNNRWLPSMHRRRSNRATSLDWWEWLLYVWFRIGFRGWTRKGLFYCGTTCRWLPGRLQCYHTCLWTGN